MSDILSRYPVVFEDEETKQVLPHYDKASNIYFNKGTSNMQSDTTQDAILELNTKINNYVPPVSSNTGNVIKLEEFTYKKTPTSQPITYADVFDNDTPKTFDFDLPTVEDDVKTSMNYMLDHITDIIYYQGLADIDWSEADTLNPVNWTNVHTAPQGVTPDISLHTPYSVRSGSGWSSQKPTTIINRTIYVSYRVWDRSKVEYGDYHTPVTLSEYESNDAYPKQSLSTPDLERHILQTFNLFYAAQIRNANNARDFIQAAIDSVDSTSILLFPKGRLHVININPIGYAYGQLDNNMQYEYDPDLDYGDITNAIAFTGLRINKRVNIDLNDSTIKIVPHWLINMALIRVTIDRWAYSTPAVINDASGTSIKNGILDGSRDQYLCTPNHIYAEHVSNITTDCDVTLEHIESKNAPGDGFTLGNAANWNSGKEVLFFHTQNGVKVVNKGYLLANGEIQTTDADNTAYSGYYSISGYNAYHQANIKLIPRPLYGWEGYDSFVDNGRYYVNEYFTVAYYKKEVNNSYTFLKIENIQFGDALSIPNGATHFRMSVMRDSLYDNSTNKFEPYSGEGDNPNSYNDYGLPTFGLSNHKNLFLSLMVAVTQNPSNVFVNNCYAHHCGRDGMTLGGLYTGLIRNCKIHDSDQVDIDIESTVYLDHDIIFDGLIGNPSVSSATGSGLRFRNCKLNNLKVGTPDITVENCDVDELQFEGRSYEQFKNISKPRRVLRNSVVRNIINACFTLFDNCVLGGDKVNDHNYDINQQGTQHNVANKFSLTEWNANYGNFKNTFVNSTIKTNIIGPGTYRDCVIMSIKYLDTEAYPDGTNDQNRYIFDNCIIKVPSWKVVSGSKNPVMSFNNCDITFTGHTTGQSGVIVGLPNSYQVYTNFYGCKLKDMLNCTVRFAPNNRSNIFEFTFVPYGNTRIENNVFIQTAQSSKTDLLNLILYNTSGNDLQSITIKDNIVDYYSPTTSVSNAIARFLFIQACAGTGNVNVLIEHNTFKSKAGANASIKDVVFTINANSNSTNYVSDAMLAAPLNVKVYDNKAIDGVIVESSDDRVGYHITNLDGPTINNLLDGIAVHHALQSIIEVSSLPASGVDGKIYYNTTTGTYNEYKNNEWSEISI